MKKMSLILAFLMVFSLFTACGGAQNTADTPKTESYTLDCGVTLTAEKGLTESVQAPFTAVLDGKNMAVLFLAESKALMPKNASLEDYASFIQSGNNLPAPFTKDSYGNQYNTNVRTVNGTDYFYGITIKESADAFWLIQMSCDEKDREYYEPLFAQWFTTIQLPETISISEKSVSDRSYDLDCGLTITMPDDMGEFILDGYDEFYNNNEVGLVLLIEDKYDGYTLEDYCDAVTQTNGTAPFTIDEYGVPFTTYTYENQGMTYYYHMSAHEFSDCFVLCQFFCMDGVRDKYESLIPAWAASLSE